MIQLKEGELEFEFPDAKSGFKFDEEDLTSPTFHGLSHCMKAVDFVVETEKRSLFVEVKDPPVSNAFDANEAYSKLMKGLVAKFRDTFIYRWAEKQINKPVAYHCLVDVDSALTLQIMTELKRSLPENGPKNGRWKQQPAVSCAVANFKDWNAAFPKWKVTRKN